MRSLHLTIMIFCQILLASFILYSNLATATPVIYPNQQHPHPNTKPFHMRPMPKNLKEFKEKDPAAVQIAHAEPEPKSAAASVETVKPIEKVAKPLAAAPVEHKKLEESLQARSAAPEPTPVAVESIKESVAKPQVVAEAPVAPIAAPVVPVAQPIADTVNPVEPAPAPIVQTPVVESAKPQQAVAEVASKREAPVPVVPAPAAAATAPVTIPEPVKPQPVASALVSADKEIEKKSDVPPQQPEIKQSIAGPAPVPVSVPAMSAPIEAPVAAPVAPVIAPAVPVKDPEASKELERKEQPMQPAPALPTPAVVTKLEQQHLLVSPPVVKGGLGPLHLLANTLCNYRPDKPVADETLNQLYCQRAQLRKSLFEFMSLKFTNLEKLSSRLNPGLEVVPPKSSGKSGVVPSHGWPIVGKCTAHDLKLMAEAAWCEREDSAKVAQSTDSLDKIAPATVSNKQLRSEGSRHLDIQQQQQQQPIAEQQPKPVDPASVISRILHVTDIKDAPVVESTIASLNLTQQQLQTIQAQATGDVGRLCKRNALRLTKALFDHLAEDQSEVSTTWPKLYTELYADDCARKRVIDIVTALSGFRSESSSIRRDNVEFAFAMDDLRGKVLDTDVNQPLTFDRQFIEVEKFLQQSVKLMLANIDPGRAKLTSMRYRSLMAGPVSADDQCIDLHQRLMANSHPTDCNPTQYGQLPDVLRMTANSLELWSVEKELAKHQSKLQDFPVSAPLQPKRTVNECIAHLVSS